MQVLFVDDDPSNIADVGAHCPVAECVHISGETGMGKGECEAVLAWAFTEAGRLLR